MRTQPAVRLAAAVAAVVFLVAAPAPASGRDTPSQAMARRQVACAPVQARALAAIEAEGRGCAEDWQCQALPSWLLGCDAWANRTYHLPEALGDELEATCGPFSFEPSCAPSVGACAGGKCTGRPHRRQGCGEARLALRAREAEPTACQADADCAGRTFPAEDHAVKEACTTPDLRQAHQEVARCVEADHGEDRSAVEASCAAAAGGPPLARSVCQERRCVLREEGPRPGALGPEGEFQAARLRDRACVMKGIRFRPADLPFPDFTVKFLVTARGAARAFSVAERRGEGTVPIAAVAEAIQSCEWIPGEIPGAGRPPCGSRCRSGSTCSEAGPPRAPGRSS